MNQPSSIDNAEINHFAKDSKSWWEESGPFKPLHKLNPARLSFITDQICTHFGRNSTAASPLKGLDILDIGCGGGLICEPLARLGGNVTGVDADPQAIDVAKDHAAQKDLSITYLNEDLQNIKQQYDVVLALEILEHVSDDPLFIGQCAATFKPGGIMIFATLNRTIKSMALGVIAAEHILRWVPKGTHSWRKFVKPSELTRHARQHALHPVNLSGIVYTPLKDEFHLSDTDLDMNYMMSLTTNP